MTTSNSPGSPRSSPGAWRPTTGPTKTPTATGSGPRGSRGHVDQGPQGVGAAAARRRPRGAAAQGALARASAGGPAHRRREDGRGPRAHARDVADCPRPPRRLAAAKARAGEAERLRADLERYAPNAIWSATCGKAQAEAEQRRASSVTGRGHGVARCYSVDVPRRARPALGRAVEAAGARIADGQVLARRPAPAAARDGLRRVRFGGARQAADRPAPPERRRGRRAAHPFTVAALGGAEEVGGSAFLIDDRDRPNVLLDAGQRVKGEYGDPGRSAVPLPACRRTVWRQC